MRKVPKILDYPPDKNHTFLNECPKCGEVELVSGHNVVWDYRVKCWRCGFATPFYKSFAEAIDKWNNSQVAVRMRQGFKKGVKTNARPKRASRSAP